MPAIDSGCSLLEEFDAIMDKWLSLSPEEIQTRLQHFTTPQLEEELISVNLVLASHQVQQSRILGPLKDRTAVYEQELERRKSDTRKKLLRQVVGPEGAASVERDMRWARVADQLCKRLQQQQAEIEKLEDSLRQADTSLSDRAAELQNMREELEWTEEDYSELERHHADVVIMQQREAQSIAKERDSAVARAQAAEQQAADLKQANDKLLQQQQGRHVSVNKGVSNSSVVGKQVVALQQGHSGKRMSTVSPVQMVRVVKKPFLDRRNLGPPTQWQDCAVCHDSFPCHGGGTKDARPSVCYECKAGNDQATGSSKGKGKAVMISAYSGQ